ncbi:ATP-binding protein [Pseudoalteromonas apostichopi]|uniref:ATP-binding protein n=1 Tax=Pseudoalteromonas apostichopi TaxID=3035452 RepID=UPI002572B27E|nr:ATP-binding protein [Pseudoalteromonas sp. FE4]
MLTFISRSLAAKVLLALTLVLLAMGASYIVLSKRLQSIEASINDISRISNYAVGILRINKDIVEMQRDISVYGVSGSKTVFSKIIENFKSIKVRLESVDLKSDELENQVYLDSMTQLITRYGDNLSVLAKRYEIKKELTDDKLPNIYFQAINYLNTLKLNTASSEEKLAISEQLNVWHELHRDASLFLAKKDYSKRAAVNKALTILSNNRLSNTKYIKSSELATAYQEVFSKGVQANRNYLSLVNVVMAGDAIEFSTLADKLREQSLTRLQKIKREAQDIVIKADQTLRFLSIGILIYIIGLAAFFHLQITHSIKRLTISFQHFLGGDLSAPIYDLNRKDEIGVLATAADRFRILSQDLTEAKTTAEHTTKVKSEFLANMSHEIRTPMNGILGMARQLRRTTLTPEQVKMLNIIQSSGSGLLVIINDILDISKIEASKIELESIPVHLNSMLDELMHLFKEQAQNKHINFNISIAEAQQDCIFFADETRLKQVLINLLGNAIKFTEKGSVSLDIRINRGQSDDLKIKFSVVDTGIGIAKENLSKLFEAFSQADTSITRRFGGTGLGLAISSKLLNLMDAPLHVESDLGQGSHFYFELKTTQVFEQSEFEAANIQEAEEEQADFSSLNVLVVEDNDINQVVIEAMLNEFGIRTIKIAGDGEQAVALCKENSQQNNFDIIFMDMQMPVLDGPQATVLIRKIPAYEDTPIIALTANVLEADKQRCFAAGMSDFIAKPIDYQCVKTVLFKWCFNENDRSEKQSN